MDQVKKCKCGNSLGDPMIIPKTRYNKKGYCGEILDSSTDEEVIEKYRYNSDISQ